MLSGASISGAYFGTGGPDACIQLLPNSKGVAIHGVRFAEAGIEFPSGSEWVYSVSVIACDFSFTSRAIINKGNCNGLTILSCRDQEDNFCNLGLSIGGGDSAPAYDSAIHFGYMSRFPVDRRNAAALVAYADGGLTDADGQSINMGSLVLAPAGDRGTSRVAIVAGGNLQGNARQLVAEFGVGDFPYAKIPAALPRYSGAERPKHNQLVPGSVIFNTTTNCLNWTDGATWYDAIGKPA